MKKLTRAECAQYLLRHDRYVLLSHARPDGDTVGSTAALCRGLRQLGKTAYVLQNPELTAKFAWLHEGLTVDCVTPEDTVVSVDVAAVNMLPKGWDAFPIALRIDHHGRADSFTEYELVDPDSASCAELVWDVLSELNVPPAPAVMTPIYVGTATDTGCFRYANTSAHTFQTAAACKEAGVDIFRLNQELFETVSLALLKMQGWMVENMTVFGDGRFAVCAIPLAVEQAMGVTKDDMDNISGFLRTVAGICACATLRQTDDDRVKLSVRAVPGFDASLVCARFGGGGHKGAAGGVTTLPLPEAKAAVIAAMTEEFA